MSLFFWSALTRTRKKPSTPLSCRVARELGLDRLQAGGIDRRGIHRRFEEIADLLLHRPGLLRSRRRVLEDALQGQLVELVELVEAAPARLVLGHGIRFLPGAERVAREVGARIGAPVDVARAEAGRNGPGGLGRGERPARERDQGRGGEEKAGGSHGEGGIIWRRRTVHAIVTPNGRKQ